MNWADSRYVLLVAGRGSGMVSLWRGLERVTDGSRRFVEQVAGGFGLALAVGWMLVPPEPRSVWLAPWLWRRIELCIRRW